MKSIKLPQCPSCPSAKKHSPGQPPNQPAASVPQCALIGGAKGRTGAVIDAHSERRNLPQCQVSLDAESNGLKKAARLTEGPERAHSANQARTKGELDMHSRPSLWLLRELEGNMSAADTLITVPISSTNLVVNQQVTTAANTASGLLMAFAGYLFQNLDTLMSLKGLPVWATAALAAGAQIYSHYFVKASNTATVNSAVALGAAPKADASAAVGAATGQNPTLA